MVTITISSNPYGPTHFQTVMVDAKFETTGPYGISQKYYTTLSPVRMHVRRMHVVHCFSLSATHRKTTRLKPFSEVSMADSTFLGKIYCSIFGPLLNFSHQSSSPDNITSSSLPLPLFLHKMHQHVFACYATDTFLGTTESGQGCAREHALLRSTV